MFENSTSNSFNQRKKINFNGKDDVETEVSK